MNSKSAACGARTLVALSVMAASDAEVNAPVLWGKNLGCTTPQAPTMKSENTGFASAAHAERPGKPSRKGRPIATAPARKKARRFILNDSGVIAHLLDDAERHRSRPTF